MKESELRRREEEELDISIIIYNTAAASVTGIGAMG